MKRVVFWDFDGVILDSMRLKGEGFARLFAKYPKEAVDKLLAYHYANGGVSRFEKIRYFYDTVLQRKVDEAEVDALAKQFGEIIREGIFDPANLIEETVAFIRTHYRSYAFHIVSGAEHNELNAQCEAFGLVPYFVTIEGSPTKKRVLIANVLEKYGYRADETVLIGDSINDKRAADANGVEFLCYNNPDLSDLPYIQSFNNITL